MSDNRDKGMFNWFNKHVPCFNPAAKEQDDRSGRSTGDGSDTPRTPRTIQRSQQDSKGKGIASSQGEEDVVLVRAEEGPMLWTTRDERHCFGNLSAAVIQGNILLEHFSRVEIARTATFIGIYDGQEDYQAAIFVSRTLTNKLMRLIRQTKTMSADILRQAFIKTEAAWQEQVDERFEGDNYIAGYGTCCLVGVFWKRTLYLANAGDSRAVIARATEGSTELKAVELTRTENVSDPVVRAEGGIQVTKSTGNAKRARFKINSPVRDDNPALSAEPKIYTIPIEPQDRFVIFASDGLWDMMDNEEAVRIVQAFPREGIAERLVTAALTEAAKNIGWPIEEVLLLRRDNGERRKVHDDITVIVVFFDSIETDIHRTFQVGCIEQGSIRVEAKLNITLLDDMALTDLPLATVCLQNLPYGTSMATLYPHLRLWGPIHYIVFEEHGFWSQVLYYCPEDAINFSNVNRNRLIISGKLMSISFIWERQYRRIFSMVDYHYILQEVPFTLRISNLSPHCTVEGLLQFFIGHGFSLRNYPIMFIRRRNLYAFASFISIEECTLAQNLDGAVHLGLPLNIDLSQAPRRIPQGYFQYRHLF